MKTKEELSALKEEVENLNKKPDELSEEELEEVSGGSSADMISKERGLKFGDYVQRVCPNNSCSKKGVIVWVDKNTTKCACCGGKLSVVIIGELTNN